MTNTTEPKSANAGKLKNAKLVRCEDLPEATRMEHNLPPSGLAVVETREYPDKSAKALLIERLAGLMWNRGGDWEIVRIVDKQLAAEHIKHVQKFLSNPDNLKLLSQVEEVQAGVLEVLLNRGSVMDEKWARQTIARLRTGAKKEEGR